MVDYNEQFATINIALTDLSQITKIQVGYDTDGNFADVFEEGSEYINLTPASRSVETTYTATNTELTRINIIKIVGKIYSTSDESVLAYRPLEYTLDITPSEDSQITVHIALFSGVDGQQEGSIELNYLEHSKVANPQTVHEKIYNLPYQPSIGNITENQFPCIIDNRGESSFDDNSTDVQRKNNTPVYFSGRGHTYSNLLWYYWNPTKINAFLDLLADKFNKNNSQLANYTLSLKNKILLQNPCLNFNARYGSYLYWYNISIDYICVICAGSNHYNAVDIFIVPNSENIEPKECQFFNNETHELRIKFNRWYNHLYFIADGHAYQINTNLADGHHVYNQEIKEVFNYNGSLTGDELIYHIRAFQTNEPDAIQILPLFSDIDSSTKFYQLEFSDIGDVLIESFQINDDETLLGIRDIFSSIYDSYYLDTPINALNLYDNEEFLFNRYMIDNPETAYRLMGLYQTTLVHLQYFLKNDYTPVYLGEEYSIGWSNVYKNYLTLFKVPTKLNRRRCASNWLDDTLYIEQGKIGHIESVENLYTGDRESVLNALLAADRGVCVKMSDFGAYRVI